MQSIQRRVDDVYDEDSELPILYRKKLPWHIRFRRWLHDRCTRKS